MSTRVLLNNGGTMKNLIVLVGIMGSMMAKADTFSRMPVEDYFKTNFDYMYEIKTAKYDKIILDCQGFIMGMSFYANNNSEAERKIYMDEELCDQVNQFLTDSKTNKEPVCLELNVEKNSIVFSRKTDECQ